MKFLLFVASALVASATAYAATGRPLLIANPACRFQAKLPQEKAWRATNAVFRRQQSVYGIELKSMGGFIAFRTGKKDPLIYVAQRSCFAEASKKTAPTSIAHSFWFFTAGPWYAKPNLTVLDTVSGESLDLAGTGYGANIGIAWERLQGRWRWGGEASIGMGLGSLSGANVAADLSVQIDQAKIMMAMLSPYFLWQAMDGFAVGVGLPIIWSTVLLPEGNIETTSSSLGFPLPSLELRFGGNELAIAARMLFNRSLSSPIYLIEGRFGI